jgi:hypothetical protein
MIFAWSTFSAVEEPSWAKAVLARIVIITGRLVRTRFNLLIFEVCGI